MKIKKFWKFSKFTKIATFLDMWLIAWCWGLFKTMWKLGRHILSNGLYLVS